MNQISVMSERVLEFERVRLLAVAASYDILGSRRDGAPRSELIQVTLHYPERRLSSQLSVQAMR
jgi:hypothetical protein